MSDSTLARKQMLRTELRAKVASLSAVVREEASARACALLQVQDIWRNASSIFFYAPLPTEINIRALVPEALSKGREVFLPRFDPKTDRYLPHGIADLEKDLILGQFGIHEPNETCAPYCLKQLDLILVPALGFDLSGSRLGRGRGFYDRLLADLSGVKCGVAFDEQIIEHVPVESHDIPVDYLLTPTRWIAVADAKHQ